MRKICCWAALFAALFHGPVVAQDKEVWEEYGKRVEKSREVSPSGPDLLGDQVSLSDGSLSFQATDVDIPGNSALPVSFSRKYAVTDRSGRYRDSPLADWDIDVPSISGVFAPDWVSASPTPQNRCSAAPAPPAVSIQGSTFYPVDYWQGIHLNLPGGSGGELLRTNAGAPKPSAGNYIWVTGDGTTHVSCLGSIANGTGEGFLAITADGTRYWFNWMAQYMEPVLKATNGTGRIPRRKNVLYATRVEDRFGNRVDYTYTNAWNQPARLTRIQANDGRALTLAYNGQGFISTVNDGVRTWTYTYSQSNLTGVELPDGSRWQIALAPLSSARIDLFKGTGLPIGEPWRTCVWQPEAVGQTEFTGSITHPSGATGQFTVEVERHGRTNVPVNCLNFTSPHNEVNDDISFWPITYDNFALKTKTIAGPGLQPATWQYDYYSPPSYYYPSGSSSHPVCPVGTDCSIPRCTSDDCAGASRTTVTGPEGKWTRYWHGNSYRYNEGKLLSVEIGAGPSSVLKRTTNSYDLNNTLRFGTSPQQRGDGFASEYVRPQLAAVVAQQGVDFTWRANAFDAFARPTSITKSSTVAGSPSKTEVTAYHDNLAKWVVGQPSKLTVGGIVASETTYNADALPTVSKRFGKTVQTLTYHADGTVATVKDGNNNVTTLSGWKRGIPQAIKYPATPEAPAGATQSAVVNDQGWITRITDENGFATHYAYDTMGRLSKITWPANDSVAWNATTFTFAKAAGSAYGLPAGHWRHTVATGNGRKVSYLDAMWRPVVVREYDSGNASSTQRFTRQTYDREGRVTFASYPSTSGTPTTGTWTEYDALGRVRSVSQDSEHGPLVTLTAYMNNADGYYTRVTSPKGEQTRTWFQAFDQPDYDTPIRITHPESAVTEIARDVFGKPTALARRNSTGSVALTRRYVYDTNQALCKTIEPETGATIMAYDGAGNLAWSKAGASHTSTSSCNTADIPVAQRTVRSYDARNRVQSLVFPDNLGNTTYSYTPDGKLAQIMVDNGGAGIVTTAYTYNKRRLPIGEALGVGSHQWGIGYGYNANGHLSAHTLPGGLTVNYAPNALGQPTQAGSYATGVSYFPNGAIKQFTYGNGTVHTLAQNARGLPERSRDVRSGTGIHDHSLDYDSHGNVAAISDGLSGSRGNRTMTYDGLDRLTGTVSPMFGTATYAYDVLDNLSRVRLSAGPKVRDHTYVYDAKQRLHLVTNTSGGGTVATLGYDAQGNLASRNGQVYAFDHGNRLRQVAGVEQYRYDGHGRRVQAIRNGASIYSVYGQDGVLRFQRDERSGKTTEYVHLGGSLLASLADPVPLATPTLTVPGYSPNGSYTITWTPSALATKYQLQEQANGGTWTTIHDAAGTSKAISGKPAGNYGYRIRACSASTCGDWSGVSTTTVQLPPAAAPTLTVPATGLNGSYTVSWTAVPSASTYQLVERLGSGSWSTIHNAAGTSKAISGKATGSWSYQVRACNAAGCGPYASVGTVQVIHPPGSAPTLTAPATNYTGGYSISWTSVATSTRYELQERLGSGSWSTIHNAAATSKAVSGKSAGSWGYRVRACNDAGCGTYSAVQATQVTRIPTSAPALTAPSSNTSGSYGVSWTSVSAATSYRLVERLGSGSWSTIHNAAATSKSVSGKTTGSWGYRVRACNVAGCGGYSAIKTVAVTRPPTSAPTVTAPSGSGTGHYSVSWTTAATSTKYQLQERLGSGSWATIHDAAGTSKAIEGKANGSWGYRARGCNGAGCGPYSAIKTVSVQLLTPAVPTGLTVTAQGSFCTFRWNTVSGTTSYKLGNGNVTFYEGTVAYYKWDAACGTAGYRVAACNANGCSAWSGPIFGSGGGGGTPVRATPAPDEEGGE